MAIYRLVVTEPRSNTLLHYEESADRDRLDELFNKALDESYLLKTARVFPEADMIVLALDERTETTEWMKKRQRVEYLS